MYSMFPLNIPRASVFQRPRKWSYFWPQKFKTHIKFILDISRHFLWGTRSYGLQPKKLCMYGGAPGSVRVPSQRPLAPSVSHVYRLVISVMMWYRGCAQIPGICLIAEEKPRKISSRSPSDEGYGTSYRLKWGPLPPNEGGRIAQHVR